uniref:Uncharacterized protein n=1 Tax=Meloidogyne enterolobii TaxID=390850 RepID=A0A6V7VBZ7_MELEN|nr:unnamed protein product [Meloidogyne enterolobii]
MFNVCKTNYRSFPSSLTKLRFLHYSRYLKNINELKESTSNLIPNEIEQNLQRWEKGIKLGFDFSEDLNVNQWMGLSLECVDFKQLSSAFITLSTKNLSKSQLSSLRFLNLNAGKNIDLKILEPNNDTNIECAFLCLSGYNLVVKTNILMLLICVEILSHNYSLKKAINLFGNREEFTKYKGYDAMLYAFKCKKMPNYGDDPDIDTFMPLYKNYDSSQLTALSALLNKKRPIVAVHGAAGTGKTLLLAQYLDILSKSDESKDMPIAVISPSVSSLYRLIYLYCSIACKEILKEIPFICLREFDMASSYFSIKNQNVLQLVKMASFHNFQRIYDEGTLRISEELKILRSQRRNHKNSSLTQHMIGLIDEEISKFIKKRRFVFLTFSFSRLQFLERIGVKFSGVIVDNAERLNEQENWHVILKTSPFVRLFGDYCQYSQKISNEQSKLDYNKTLLQRLDEDFGVDSNVNFHLNRQYTSNPAIRAWGDSVFYKERKAIPATKSVENMNLNEILKPNIKKNNKLKLVTEPLVLVDISKLEGEWKEFMFESEKVAITNVQYNYEAFRNWGMALITAQHINLLIDNGIDPKEIACPLSSFYHHLILEEVFGILWPYNLYKFKRICISVQRMLTGLHFSVYIRAFLDNEFASTENDHLKLLTNWNFGLSKAKYQFMLICDSNNLKNNCIPKMKEMLECFQSTRGGIIVGPTDIFPLKSGQFEEIKNLTKKRLREFK